MNKEELVKAVVEKAKLSQKQCGIKSRVKNEVKE